MDYHEFKLKVKGAITLMNLLLDDMDFARVLVENEIEEVKKSPSYADEQALSMRMQPLFRIMTRSTIAAIEGFCYQMKNISLLLCDYMEIPVSAKERADILEKKVNEDGTIRNHFIESQKNILLTFKMLHKAFGSEFKLVDPAKWNKLCTAIYIRNRITHPKDLSDMMISAIEYSDESEGFEWFSRSIMQLLKTQKKLHVNN